MSYEQLLHDFVDGSLDYQGEMTLFSELQSNEALRRELKLLMLMQKAAQHDVRAFTPAPESHDAIFARLGFSPGLAEEHPTRGARGSSGGSFGTGITGGIIGALVVGMIVILSGRWMPTPGDTASTQVGPAGGSAARKRGTAPRPAIPRAGESPQGAEERMDGGVAGSTMADDDVTGMSRAGASGMSDGNAVAPRAADGAIHPAGSEGRRRGEAAMAISSRRGGRTSGRDLDERDRADVAELAESAITERRIAHTARATSSRAIGVDPAIPTAHATAPGIAPSPIEGPKSPELSPLDGASRVSIGLRGIIDRDFRTIPGSLASRSNGILFDRAIGLEYRLDVNQRVGIEAGQESFYQRFTELLPTGDILQHEQNPTLFEGGVSFTQLFGDGLGVQPFVKGFAGGTRMGPLGRLTAGAEYEVGSNVLLMAGGEIGALAYRFDGAWFFSPNYGFTYGLSMRF
jgi:hypothetical protein